MNYIISVGAGKNQLPLIKGLLKSDYRVIAFDRNPDAPGKKYCDLFKDISTWDSKIAIRWLDHLNLKYTGVGCFSYGKALVTQQKIAEYFGLPGRIPLRVSVLSGDKRRLREKLYAENMSTISEILVSDFLNDKIELNYNKYIVKHKIGVSSSNIFLRSKEGLISDIRRNFIDEEWIIQEFIPGNEYRIFALVQKKDIKFFSIMARKSLEGTFFTGRLKPIYTNADWGKKLVLQILNKLNINEGIIKIDVIKGQNRAEILEIDFGIAGDYFETYIAPLCYNYDFTNKYIDFITGKNIKEIHFFEGMYNCFDYFYNLNRSSSLVVKYDKIERFLNIELDKYLLIKFRESKEKVSYPQSNQDAVLAVLHNKKEINNYQLNLKFNEMIFNE